MNRDGYLPSALVAREHDDAVVTDRTPVAIGDAAADRRRALRKDHLEAFDVLLAEVMHGVGHIAAVDHNPFQGPVWGGHVCLHHAKSRQVPDLERPVGAHVRRRRSADERRRVELHRSARDADLVRLQRAIVVFEHDSAARRRSLPDTHREAGDVDPVHRDRHPAEFGRAQIAGRAHLFAKRLDRIRAGRHACEREGTVGPSAGSDRHDQRTATAVAQVHHDIAHGGLARCIDHPTGNPRHEGRDQ